MKPIKDPIRFAARRMLPKAAYHELSRFINAVWVIVAEGWTTYNTLMRSQQPGDPPLREIHLRAAAYPVMFRPDTPDVACLVQNLVRSEYGRIRSSRPPKVIIDAGAYIGDVSIYFLNRFPTAKVIALEPSHEHYALAMINLAPYSDRVLVLNQGLWHERKTMRLVGDYTSGELREAAVGAKNVSCIDLQSLLSDLSIDHVDIVKLDIEGAEAKVLLLNSDSWLRRTDNLIIEFHGPGIELECCSMLQSKGFKSFRYRSLQYFYRNDTPEVRQPFP